MLLIGLGFIAGFCFVRQHLVVAFLSRLVAFLLIAYRIVPDLSKAADKAFSRHFGWFGQVEQFQNSRSNVR